MNLAITEIADGGMRIELRVDPADSLVLSLAECRDIAATLKGSNPVSHKLYALAQHAAIVERRPDVQTS